MCGGSEACGWIWQPQAACMLLKPCGLLDVDNGTSQIRIPGRQSRLALCSHTVQDKAETAHPAAASLCEDGRAGGCFLRCRPGRGECDTIEAALTFKSEQAQVERLNHLPLPEGIRADVQL
ncbi:unnamed protein product [Rangifer tarandus platyrhynchus]|uniref:Uncharacterized protein n=2 Tax=Rangifer tarandus platyrhynchus TaxID=3082113 RepID=A0ABN8ZB84_RANTA|nr:unnamed protein product [Rangifer tarandus platyrhynchus]CAI9705652.1 unnamed protein product [Rangifer tarandus platyrhynchus]